MKNNCPKECRTVKLNLYQISQCIVPNFPVIVAAANITEAYDTFKKEFLDEKCDDTEYCAKIDAICKIGEYLAISDSAFEKIKNELK